MFYAGGLDKFKGHSCATAEADLASAWGCRAPAEHPTVEPFPCPWCGGEGEVRGGEKGEWVACDDAWPKHQASCQGGDLEVYHCPTHALDALGDAFLRAFNLMESHLPVAGGTLDQANKFIVAADHLRGAIAAARDQE